MGKLGNNFSLSGNLAINTDKPIDSRCVVTDKSDLTSVDVWENFQYVGMTVAVVADAISENNGLYMFIGPNKADVDNIESWYRLDGQTPTWVEAN